MTIIGRNCRRTPRTLSSIFFLVASPAPFHRPSGLVSVPDARPRSRPSRLGVAAPRAPSRLTTRRRRFRRGRFRRRCSARRRPLGRENRRVVRPRLRTPARQRRARSLLAGGGRHRRRTGRHRGGGQPVVGSVAPRVQRGRALRPVALRPRTTGGRTRRSGHAGGREAANLTNALSVPLSVRPLQIKYENRHQENHADRRQPHHPDAETDDLAHDVRHSSGLAGSKTRVPYRHPEGSTRAGEQGAVGLPIRLARGQARRRWGPRARWPVARTPESGGREKGSRAAGGRRRTARTVRT